MHGVKTTLGGEWPTGRLHRKCKWHTLIHREKEIGSRFHLFDVCHSFWDFAKLESTVSKLRGSQGGVGLVIADTADHQLGDGVEGELRRFASEHLEQHARGAPWRVRPLQRRKRVQPEK